MIGYDFYILKLLTHIFTDVHANINNIKIVYNDIKKGISFLNIIIINRNRHEIQPF